MDSEDGFNINRVNHTTTLTYTSGVNALDDDDLISKVIISIRKSEFLTMTHYYRNLFALLVTVFSFNLSAADSTDDPASMVVEFYTTVFVDKGNVRAVSEKLVHPDYIQHNPYVGDGREAMVKALSAWMKKRPASVVTEIKRVMTDGDFVILHVHQRDTATQQPGHAGVDIFRVADGKIVEHCDVWQKIPETMPHNNGMF